MTFHEAIAQTAFYQKTFHFILSLSCLMFLVSSEGAFASFTNEPEDTVSSWQVAASSASLDQIGRELGGQSIADDPEQIEIEPDGYQVADDPEQIEIEPDGYQVADDPEQIEIEPDGYQVADDPEQIEIEPDGYKAADDSESFEVEPNGLAQA